MKKTIVKKPISQTEYATVLGKHALTDLILMTGVRIAEAKSLVDKWDTKSNYVDIHTKKSGDKVNRIYLNEKAISSIKKLITTGWVNKSIKTYDRCISQVSQETGVVFTAHNLRSTFATRLLENGVDLVTVSTLMNHSDISITAQYISLTEGRMMAAVESVEKVETLEGNTLFEMWEENQKLKEKIRRLEHVKN